MIRISTRYLFSTQFLKFMNHKKSRLTDLFRKMDKNNDGLIPREDFIQGIMNTSDYHVIYCFLKETCNTSNAVIF